MSVTLTTEMLGKVDSKGYAIVENVFSPGEVYQLLSSLERISDSAAVRKRGSVFAVRNLLNVSPEIKHLAAAESVHSLVAPILGDHFLPVRGILFDKVPDANWKVPWHQDLTIAVQERVEAAGFGPWSTKADVLHVQPPASVLEQMLTVRLHLDHCGEDNGALRVLPGSHRLGRIPEEDIGHLREETVEEVCTVGVGGALLMRPLLLHASSPSKNPGHRRVVHLDFAAASLPSGMRWFSEETQL